MNVETNIALSRRESYPDDWRRRFAEAYRRQNRTWLDAVRTGVPPAVAASA